MIGVALRVIRIERLTKGVFSDLAIWSDKGVFTSRDLFQDVVP